MSGILPLSQTTSEMAATSRAPDRAVAAVRTVLKQKQAEGEALVRLVEGATASGKGQHVDYHA